MSDSASALELLSDLLNRHQYNSQFLSFLVYICILLKVFTDNTFLFALITESSIMIDKHLHGAFSFSIF